MALAGIGLGLALMVLVGGHARALSQLELRGLPQLALLYAAQATVRSSVTELFPEGAIVACWLAIAAALLVLLARKVSWPGMILVWTGVFSNALVVSANGGMPVAIGENVVLRSGFYHRLTEADHLVFLADILPVTRGLLSAGDVLMIVGIAVTVSACSIPKGLHSLEAVGPVPASRPSNRCPRHSEQQQRGLWTL